MPEPEGGVIGPAARVGGQRDDVQRVERERRCPQCSRDQGHRPGPARQQQHGAEHGQCGARGVGKVEGHARVRGVDREPPPAVGGGGPVAPPLQSHPADRRCPASWPEEQQRRRHGQPGECHPAGQQAHRYPPAAQVQPTHSHPDQQIGGPWQDRVVAGECERAQQRARIGQGGEAGLLSRPGGEPRPEQQAGHGSDHAGQHRPHSEGGCRQSQKRRCHHEQQPVVGEDHRGRRVETGQPQPQEPHQRTPREQRSRCGEVRPAAGRTPGATGGKRDPHAGEHGEQRRRPAVGDQAGRRLRAPCAQRQDVRGEHPHQRHGTGGIDAEDPSRARRRQVRRQDRVTGRGYRPSSARPGARRYGAASPPAPGARSAAVGAASDRCP